MAMLANNIFLKIISKEIPAKVVHEDALCLAFHDVNPQAPTHVLIIPKKEIRTHADLTAADAAVMGHIHLVAAKLARQLGLGAGYRLVINSDEQAGQTVPHLHVHLLGGRGDGLAAGVVAFRGGWGGVFEAHREGAATARERTQPLPRGRGPCCYCGLWWASSKTPRHHPTLLKKQAMTTDDIRTALRDRLAHVTGRITDAAGRSGRPPDAVTLVAVSKTATPEVAAVAFDLGVRDFGESRPQELWKKHAALPSARWHLIGHLQRNKIDKTIPLVRLVHSVDSERVLAALNDLGSSKTPPVEILLEVNCSREASKGGFPPEAVRAVADAAVKRPGIILAGLMTMAAHRDDPRDCRPTFAELRGLRDALRKQTGLPLPYLSMGMSNDYGIAVEEGATHVRVGSTLFEGLTS